MGKRFLDIYRLSKSLKGRIFSFIIAGSFARYGKKSLIMPPLRLYGENRIEIGDHVLIGPYSWLHAFPSDGKCPVAISIGNGVAISGSCVLSATKRIILENDVLIGPNVCMVDHIHKFTNHHVAIKNQGIDKIAPIIIRRGAWIGQNVVICPGVTVGIGSVVGANSVVNQDIPDYCLAVGSPAKIVKNFSTSI